MFEFLFKYPLSIYRQGTFIFLAGWPLWLMGLGALAGRAIDGVDSIRVARAVKGHARGLCDRASDPLRRRCPDELARGVELGGSDRHDAGNLRRAGSDGVELGARKSLHEQVAGR